jgi:aryl-alcohol dehydrogenase-like predicted oxidoreductase
MHFRSLGASGLNLPVMALNTANFLTSGGGRAAVDERTVVQLVDLAIDHGASLFSISNLQHDRQALLGKTIGKRRSQQLVALQMRPDAAQHFRSSSRHRLIRECEASLQRMGTDYLDLLEIHQFDAGTPLEETLAACASLIEAGKVRYIGCADFAGWQLMKALAVADRNSWPRFISHQFASSLVERRCDAEWLPLAEDQKIGSIIRCPLAGGLLAGNYGNVGHSAAVSAALECLAEIAYERGTSKAQVALAWVLQRPSVASVLVGVSCAEQLEADLVAIDLALSGDQLVRLDDIGEPMGGDPWLPLHIQTASIKKIGVAG